MLGGETMAELPGLPTRVEGWIASYLAQAGEGDVMRGDMGRGARWWNSLLEGVAGLTGGRLALLQERVERQINEIGTAFRLPDESEERPWPVSALPLLIGEDEWRGIAEGVTQRAALLESLLGDIYGEQKLVADGALPASLVAGSPHFWRSMIGIDPPGGHRLHIYAADLGRGPDGEWRVLADHVRAPTGAGYALENRLAASRVMGTLQQRLHVQRLAGFFSAFRDGLAAACNRADPRIGLLTPGRYNQSYAEQAHLARYLGLLLVEGEDLAVREGRLYVRTIEGLKRIDALWRRMDSRFIDPLAFDATSAIGVPGLMDAVANGTVIANAPGVGVVESTALGAFLPVLARRLTGQNLLLPNIATWWCGQENEHALVRSDIDHLLIAPAFGGRPGGLRDGRARLGAEMEGEARRLLIEDMERRPQDYVGQEVVRLSTMPAMLAEGTPLPRPFTLRVFAARDGVGNWAVMPGGFARLSDTADIRAAVIGEGAFSADVCVVAHKPVEQVSRLPAGGKVAIRRNPGTLPSRAADNLFWLGRYLERGEASLRLVRAALGGTIDADSGAALAPETAKRVATLLVSSGAVPEKEEGEGITDHGDVRALAEAALDGRGIASVKTLLATVRAIGEGTRDRLSAEVWRLLDTGPPPEGAKDSGALLDRTTRLQERFSALAGLAAENMGRTAGWRFHDLGRRIERGVLICRLLRTFAPDEALADDLTTLLDLCDSQISYRSRYLSGLALEPVRDLIALDPFNPRSLAYQVERIGWHLGVLPKLSDDGMPEEHDMIAADLAGSMATATAARLSHTRIVTIENKFYALSEAISRRFFLQGSESLRAAGMTRLA